MLWWFLILAASAGAVLWAGVAAYLRVHRHMKEASKKEALNHEADKL
jgi:ABC-type uncharacterized transport system permease subunit